MDMASRGEDQGVSQSQPVAAPKSAVGQHGAMVEKVARALHSEFNASNRGDYQCRWDDPLASRDYFRAQARAAIEAMREPTEGMILAGMASSHEDTCQCSAPWLVIEADDGYRAMIDAALNPPD